MIASKRLYLECYRRAVAPYVRRDMEDSEMLRLRPRSEMRFLEDVVGKEVLAECVADFYRHYEELHDTHFDGIFPGVPEMLSTLRDAGRPLGIVTGKSRKSWEITLARAELGPFDVLVFEDDVRGPKPDPHGITLALEALRVEPERAVYVGDTSSDMEAAATAGVLPVAALWSRNDRYREQLAELALDLGGLVVDTPAELAEAFARDLSRGDAYSTNSKSPT